MKAFAPSDTFVGLPERGRFATEPVILNFLIIRTKLAILTSKPSAFNDLKILSWEQTLFVKELYSSSRVIWNFRHDNLQMVWKRRINITTLWLSLLPWQRIQREQITCEDTWLRGGWGQIWKLCVCLHTAQIAFQQADSYFNLICAAFSSLTTEQNKTCDAFGLWDHLSSLSIESKQVSVFKLWRNQW